MSGWYRILDVDTVEQKKSYYCGPATIQMGLESVGDKNIPSQNSLYALAQKYNAGPLGFVNPTGMEFALNAQPLDPKGGQPREWAIMISDSAYRATATAVYGIAAGAASGALIEVIDHWVAVIGAQTDVDPAEGTSFEILAVWICDPEARSAEHVPYYPTWLTCYFIGSPSFDKQYVVVSPWQLAQDAALRAPESVPAPYQPPPPGRLLEPHRAVDAAKRGTEAYGLQRFFAEKMPRPPHLVKCIGSADDRYYYLVPFDDGGREHLGKRTSVVRVDASTGTYLGAQLDRTDYHFESFAKIADRLRQSNAFPHGTDLKVHEPLVWQPSAQTTSPYNPLYRVTAGGTEVYVDRNLRIYPQLTLDRCG